MTSKKNSQYNPFGGYRNKPENLSKLTTPELIRRFKICQQSNNPHNIEAYRLELGLRDLEHVANTTFSTNFGSTKGGPPPND